MKAADSLDLAVRKAARREPVLPPSSPGSRMLAEALSHEAGVVSDRVDRVARIIFSFDQEAIERPFDSLSAVGKQTYYDIALAVIPEARL